MIVRRMKRPAKVRLEKMKMIPYSKPRTGPTNRLKKFKLLKSVVLTELNNKGEPSLVELSAGDIIVIDSTFPLRLFSSDCNRHIFLKKKLSEKWLTEFDYFEEVPTDSSDNLSEREILFEILKELKKIRKSLNDKQDKENKFFKEFNGGLNENRKKF